MNLLSGPQNRVSLPNKVVTSAGLSRLSVAFEIECPIVRLLATAIRARLDPWLGKPQWKQSAGRVTIYYRFESEMKPVTPMRLKVEINTREHFTVLGFERVGFVVENPWYRGGADVLTYPPEELLGTMLRALYQRRKGRDLFDPAEALQRLPGLDHK